VLAIARSIFLSDETLPGGPAPQIRCRGIQDVTLTQNCALFRAEARLQEINLFDQLAGSFVRELACPRHAVELGPFGAKPNKPELPLDLVNLASQRSLFAGFGPAVDALAIGFHDANPGIGIKVGVAAVFTHVVLRPFNGLNRDFGRRDACQILFLLLRRLGR
jgi:hypothetical protein